MARSDVSGSEPVERLSVEDVTAATISASEHTHRYRWAARLVPGLRVLDLCCGVGYGSAILATEAAGVTGVDASAEAIETAQQAEAVDGVTFTVGDAMALLAEPDLGDRFDAIVCFEGLEHLPDLGRAIDALAAHAAEGMRIVASLPNSRTFGEDNPFHLTDPDLDVALAAFERLPGAVLALQYVAEGSLIVTAEDAAPGEPEIALLDRVEPEYANNFLVTVNVPAEDQAAALDGLARLTMSPYFNRQLASLQHANGELWQVNRRLGRQLRALTAGTDGDDIRAPAWEALRQGQTSAGRTLAKLLARADEQSARAAAAEAEAAAGRHRAWELEVELQEVGRRVKELEEDVGVAWGRYHDLHNRRIVKAALKSTRFLRRGG